LPFFPIGDDVRHDATPVYESFWLGTTGSDLFRPFIAIKTQNRPLSRAFSSQKLPAKRAIMPLPANEIKISLTMVWRVWWFKSKATQFPTERKDAQLIL
jgi:hypothetical protein